MQEIGDVILLLLVFLYAYKLLFWGSDSIVNTLGKALRSLNDGDRPETQETDSEEQPNEVKTTRSKGGSK